MDDAKTRVVDWHRAYLDLVFEWVAQQERQELFLKGLDSYAAVLLGGDISTAAAIRAELERTLTGREPNVGA